MVTMVHSVLPTICLCLQRLPLSGPLFVCDVFVVIKVDKSTRRNGYRCGEEGVVTATCQHTRPLGEQRIVDPLTTLEGIHLV